MFIILCRQHWNEKIGQYDYFQFQLDELIESNLVSDDKLKLEEELKTLANSEEIKRSLYKQFRNHVEFDFTNLSEVSDFNDRLKEQGVQLI